MLDILFCFSCRMPLRVRKRRRRRESSAHSCVCLHVSSSLLTSILPLWEPIIHSWLQLPDTQIQNFLFLLLMKEWGGEGARKERMKGRRCVWRNNFTLRSVQNRDPPVSLCSTSLLTFSTCVFKGACFTSLWDYSTFCTKETFKKSRNLFWLLKYFNFSFYQWKFDFFIGIPNQIKLVLEGKINT